MDFLEINVEDLEVVTHPSGDVLEDKDKPAPEVAPENQNKDGEGVQQPDTDDNNQNLNETEFAILAKRFKEKGLLIDEVEVEDDFDYDKLESAFEKSFLKKNEDLVRQKIYEELREEGITQEVIENVRKINAGINNNDELLLDKYGKLALIDLSQVPEENREAELLLWTKVKYLERGYEEIDAENAAARDIEKDANAVIKANKEFFLQKYGAKKEEIEAKIVAANKAKEDRIKQERQRVESILDKGEIAGEKFTEEQIKKIKKGLFEATETVKIGDAYYKVPLLQKKQIERQNNPELQLLESVYLLLDINPKETKKIGKEEGAKEIEKKFLNAVSRQGFDARENITTKDNNKVFIELDAL